MIGAAIIGAIFVGTAGSLVVLVFGVDYGSTGAVVIACAIFFPVLFVGTASAVQESYISFKEHPRGLGQRRVRKWNPDGSAYYDWEKY